MVQKWMYSVTAIALLASSALLPVGNAFAQQAAPELVGTWDLVLVDNILPDGTRSHLYGPNPHGVLMFDAGGHYSLQIMSAGRPKFTANDKSKGTPDEYRAAVQGSNCHFGTYIINALDHTVTLYVEHATFANWEGAALTWPFTVAGDEAKLIVPHPTTGSPGVTGEIVWKRIH